MKRYSTLILLGLLLITLIGLFFQHSQSGAGNLLIGKDSASTANVVVILPGEDSDRWISFKQGVRHACADLNIEETIMFSGADAQEEGQIEILDREISFGADGFIIAPYGSESMREYLLDTQQRTSILTVENSLDPALPFVGIDGAEIGKSMAHTVAESSHGQVFVLSDDSYQDCVLQRSEAFLKELQPLGLAVTELNSFSQLEEESFHWQSSDTLVVFENRTLEQASEFLETLKTRPKLYGVGNSNALIQQLDQGGLKVLYYPDEFSMGYLAVYQLAEQMGLLKHPPEATIAYTIVTRENMFSQQIEQIIFPML